MCRTQRAEPRRARRNVADDDQAIFALEEYNASSALTLQLGGRYEHQTIKLGVVDTDLPAFPGFEARSGEKHAEAAESTSAAREPSVASALNKPTLLFITPEFPRAYPDNPKLL